MTIEQIRAANKAAGFFFFEPDTVRFFRSRILPTVHSGPGGVYFLTSEQFVSSRGVASPRRYTVRKFNPGSGDIDTVGEFNSMSKAHATKLAKRCAAGEND